MTTTSSFKLASCHLIQAGLLVGSILFLSGCKSGPPRPKPISLTLKIQPAGKAASLTIPVYVGAADSRYDAELLGKDVDEILISLRSGRRADVHAFQLTTGGREISKKNPLWSQWVKKEFVVVIADLPKNFGGANKRRVEIPLDKRLWKQLPSDKIVRVEINEEEVRLLDKPVVNP